MTFLMPMFGFWIGYILGEVAGKRNAKGLVKSNTGADCRTKQEAERTLRENGFGGFADFESEGSGS